MKAPQNERKKCRPPPAIAMRRVLGLEALYRQSNVQPTGPTPNRLTSECREHRLSFLIRVALVQIRPVFCSKFCYQLEHKFRLRGKIFKLNLQPRSTLLF